ncbi:MAG TPA: luciferase family protein [Candidatus Angelobacter sp.]
MQKWSALLGTELASWPAVTSRRMFGMTVFYRTGVIFAALPRTRSFETPRSVAFKLHRKGPRTLRMLASDRRIAHPVAEGGKWISFELSDENDLKHALKWFDLAYRTCLSQNNSQN